MDIRIHYALNDNSVLTEIMGAVTEALADWNVRSDIRPEKRYARVGVTDDPRADAAAFQECTVAILVSEQRLPERRHFVICSLDNLANRLSEELMRIERERPAPGS